MTEQNSIQPPPRKQTGVPRRFGVSVMLVITTMYAVLFAVLQKTPAGFFVTVALFFTVVGLAQAVLFKGRNPRKASIVTGTVLGGLFIFVRNAIEIVRLFQLLSHLGPLTSPVIFRQFVILLVMTLCGVVFGALLGYLAGGLIAAVFLFLNKVQPPLDDSDDGKPTEADDASEKPADNVAPSRPEPGKRARA